MAKLTLARILLLKKGDKLIDDNGIVREFLSYNTYSYRITTRNIKTGAEMSWYIRDVKTWRKYEDDQED